MAPRSKPGHFSIPQALLLDPEDAAFKKDASWQALFDELRPGRPASPKERLRWRHATPVRGLVFEPPVLAEGQPEPQDVVQLHLEHRLVKRLLSRFASQGFRASVGRITAIVGAGAQPRVVLIGRLSLFGPGARRLHEEIIPITAAWRDTRRAEAPLTPFAEVGEATTIAQLDVALRKGVAPGSGIVSRLQATAEQDIADLRPHLEDRAASAETEAARDLQENGAREAEALEMLLSRQIVRVREAMAEKQVPLQFSFDLRSDEQKRQADKEQRQYEADRRSWDDKLARLERDLADEPDKVRDGYGVKARQLEPLALVYLWPATN